VLTVGVMMNVAVRHSRQAVAVVGSFFRGSNFIYKQIRKKIQGAKMSLFGYSLAILCMQHLPFGGQGYWGGG